MTASAAPPLHKTMRGWLERLVLLMLAGLASGGWSPAEAHENLPLVVTLKETASGQYALTLRLPGNIDPAQRPRFEVANPCRVHIRSASTTLFDCPNAARPDRIGLAWPGGVPSSAILFRTQFRDGEANSKVFAPGAAQLDLPRLQTPLQVIGSYLRIGTEHIILGLDHLLFLTCLIMIATTPRRIATTVTGFTLGHAVTISLASLGIVTLDGALVEALIALSIVFVATELVRRDRNTLFLRYPAAVAAGFGTLHGLGFAGALAKIGLAPSSVTWSLVGFNLGVEIGQLVFVVAVMALVWLGGRLPPLADRTRLNARARFATVTGIGVIASFWFWERSILLFA
ncbi:HupE/UreJ family protein [Novosphingobium malaysiense]|uniref:HupE/UreJ family protein n=1 Tax=Novosphingobium malaysiense TaxID=1348853 RepID=UPI000691776C|nr:HupE/UreJ family protein [Novosphingobium malaysiense]